MAVANFIPEVWSLKLLKIFDKSVVMAGLVNRDYEGEISDSGNTVHVRTFGDITINNYTRDQIVDYQGMTDPMSNMTIDQQKYFAFKLDDLDKAQADVKIMEGYSSRAAVSIKEVVDLHLHSHYADVPAANVVGGSSSAAPITLAKDNIYQYITQLGQKLDEANCPQEGRNLVITPKFKQMLVNAPEFIRATGMGDSVVTNGRIGEINNFSVSVTTNANTANGNTPLLAFTKDFISYASQVAKVEKVRPSGMFADAVQGLYLYGSKVFTNTSSSKGPDKCAALLWAEGV